MFSGREPNSKLSDSASHLFDSSGVEIEFSFEQCADPIRTKAGQEKGTQPILFGTVSKTCFLAFVLSRFLAVLA